MTEPSLPEESIFAQALEVPCVERAGFLDRACGDNALLRAEVEALLRAHQRAGDLLDVPDDAASTTDRAGGERPGAVLGPYKLLQEIGEGGMGSVFMAEQSDPIQRRVALKVVKEGMDTKQVLARFEAERQALALMDHPNIAKVFDAGRTPSGRPYFVMELVKGQPITKYCDEKRLGVRERLELFADVCRAVQHAHQKGVIHRDIKPSNVLVAPYDGRPVVKVIDFGLAKATGIRLTEQTLFTGFGAVVGTPEYMSPEQAEVNNQDIDTRSDVYSLGVLLYELLTGSTPLTRKRAKEAAFLEVLRVIREEEPPRPSTRLSESKDALPSISEQRHTEPAKLTRLVRGELDWIVMKALDKDRNRRYETANGFAADVQRYLADEAVQACPPSAAYRVRKFVRRNKGPVLAAGIFALLLVAGIIGTTTGLVRALAAEQATGEALTRLETEQGKTQSALLTARDALDTLTDDVVAMQFAREPELDATQKAFVRKVLGFYEMLTRQVGDTAEARFLQAKGKFNVAYLRAILGQSQQAVEDYQEVVALFEQLAREFPDAAEYRYKLARTEGNLGILLAELGKEVEAERVFRQGIALRQQLEKDSPKVPQYRAELASQYNDLGIVLEKREKFGAAAEAFREALDRLERLAVAPGAGPAALHELASTRANLGQLLCKQRKYADAEKILRQALTVQEEQLHKSPTAPRWRRQLADSYHFIGIVFAQQRKPDEAEKAFRQALALHKKLVDDFPKVVRLRRSLARVYHDLGWLLLQQGKDEATTAWQQALAQWKQLAAEAPNDPEFQNEVAATLGKLASLAIERRDFSAALPLLEEARPFNEAALAANATRPAYRVCNRNNLQTLAQAHLGLGDHARLATTAEELGRLATDSAQDTYMAACIVSSCATVVAGDTQLADARREALRRGYADRAMVLLRQAVARGFKDVGRLKSDHDLDPVRAHDQFRRLLAEVEAKSKQ
jgi:serine/threonine protein kinase/tetratricopeptide (TPR) repeat protein